MLQPQFYKLQQKNECHMLNIVIIGIAQQIFTEP